MKYGNAKLLAWNDSLALSYEPCSDTTGQTHHQLISEVYV